MKKLYTTPDYKEWHHRRLVRIEKDRRNENRPNRPKPKKKRQKRKKNELGVVAVAPKDFRLIENTEECLLFFRNLHSPDYLNQLQNARFVIMSLEDVEKIDYGTISILTAIGEYLSFKNIIVRGDLPKHEESRKFIMDSGFLDYVIRDDNKQKFPKAGKSDLIFFEKGSGKLSDEGNRKITKVVQNVVKHLTDEFKHCEPVKTIILEICGNSIEWSGTENKQWLLGVKYEDNKVIFTLADVGKGILQTLNRRFKMIIDTLTIKSQADILERAFNQKYGSSTGETNRNKGLPAVKARFTDGKILNLVVITNNVILDFVNNNKSKTFPKGAPRFRGTFYQWEMTNGCINNSTN